ncbi:tyrosine-type recombinase/integrase [Bacillus cereus]|nr:tyrosine-type recombinase/integrase [Bacillus cereus]
MLLKFAMQDFKEEKEFANLTTRTIGAYMMTLYEFQAWCADRELIDTRDVREATIKSYLVYCQKERKNGVVTRNSKLHHLKIFFNYLQHEEIITEKGNPIRRMKLAREDTKIEVFQDEHIKQMLRYYRRLKTRNKSFYAYRDHTIIVFLLGTGSRLGELINIRWSELDLVNQQATLYGKARKQQSVPLTDKLIKELCEYKIFLERELGKLPEFVFTTREGTQMSPNSVKLMFKRLKSVMNFKDVRLSAHTFRHTFAHRCLMAGMDVFTLQRMMRHNSLRMTERYLSLWGTALKEQNDKFNPLNNLEF